MLSDQFLEYRSDVQTQYDFELLKNPHRNLTKLKYRSVNMHLNTKS